MKNTLSDDADELRPEYDLTQMQLRKVGPGRRMAESSLVQLAPDVAEMFPDAQAVNEALRFLIRIARFDESDQGHPVWASGSTSS
jgi:hypothetical protein